MSVSWRCLLEPSESDQQRSLVVACRREPSPHVNAADACIGFGNFTRHRVAENGLKPKINMKDPESKREYQRINTTYAGPSNNLTDFAPIRFVE